MTEKDHVGSSWSWGSKSEAVRGAAYNLGLTTKESNILGTEIDRPWGLLAERADIYKEIVENWGNKEEKIKLLEKAKIIDNLFEQFLKNVKNVEVDMGTLGKQSSEYVELIPKGADLEEPPIIVVTGIANNYDGCAGFGIILAFLTNKKVVIFGHPESSHGKVTNKFAEAVEKSDNFGPHKEFFKSAINQVVGEETEIDICGVSAGSIIVTELMKDKNFNKKINQANLIAPPGEMEVKPQNVLKRLWMEGKALVADKQIKFWPKLIASDLKPAVKNETDWKAMKKTFKAMTDKLSHRYEWWKNDLISGKGNNTRVIIFKNDGVTLGIEGIGEIRRKNPNLELTTMDGGHGTGAIESEKVIKEMKF